MAGPKGSVNSCSFLALAWSWHFPWTCSQWLKLRPFGVHTAGHPLPSGGSAILWLGACALEPTQTWVQILTLLLVSSRTLLCLSFLTCEMKEIMPTVLGGPRLKDNLKHSAQSLTTWEMVSKHCQRLNARGRQGWRGCRQEHSTRVRRSEF